LVYSIIFHKIVELSKQFVPETAKGYLEHPMAQYTMQRFEPKEVKKYIRDKFKPEATQVVEQEKK
jgi:hypothetical protein